MELTEFELQRQQLIARNRARLLALGIPEAVSGLAKLQPVKAVQPKKHKAPQKPKTNEPEQPSRQSTRLRDQAMVARGEVPPEVEQGSELAMFIIDGECPRCGKVLSTGHARHLETCKGPPEPPTEEEIAQQAERYKSQVKEKLRQLELGGLVDFDPGAAAVEPAGKKQKAAAAQPASSEPKEKQQQQGKKKGRSTKKAAAVTPAAAAVEDGPYAIFIVIGSTGNHYVVKLSDEKRSCTCMDHRIRRRDCKHIRLIWEQLGVTDKPQDWQQALQQQVSELSAADAADVDMVKQAQARAEARKQKAAAKTQDG